MGDFLTAQDRKRNHEKAKRKLKIGRPHGKKERRQKAEEKKMAKEKKINMVGKSVVVRADRAGVFAGILKEKNGTEIVLENCRRLWYWDGAASISQIAVDGVSKPENCKFPESVTEALIEGAIEIIPMTEKAVKSINAVPVWKK